MIAITDKEFAVLADFVKSHCGIRLGKEKKALLVVRLHNVLAGRQLTSFSEYCDYLLADKTGEALMTLIEKLTTNHTYFMREVEHLAFFRDSVLPYLERHAKERDLRIWSAGCSTGEEPYALAMTMADYFGPDKRGWDTKILATDISARVLEIAERGVYANEQTASVPDSWKRQYFGTADRDSRVVVNRIRDEVIFRAFNLMKPAFPFKRKFHVIFCKNVMIYFDAETKRRLIHQFYEHTERGGFLFIGHSESLNRGDSDYRYVMPSVYRKE